MMGRTMRTLTVAALVALCIVFAAGAALFVWSSKRHALAVTLACMTAYVIGIAVLVMVLS